MNRLNAVVLLLVTSFLLSTTAFAAGNSKAGQEKVTQCVACHGPEGNSTVGTWPKLAGQNAPYLMKQMMEYKKGDKGGRYDAVMTPLMATLSTQDMQDLAAYYAAQKVIITGANKDLLAQGQALYRGGDFKKHITACIACHGPQGTGNAGAGFPALSGQHAQYIVAQLEAYQSGKRKNDLNHIMQDISKRMDKNDMLAVADYISGLH